MNRQFFLFLSLITLLSACSKDDNTVPVNSQLPEGTVINKELNNALADFSYDLFAQTVSEGDEGKNVVLSPLSITSALSMVYQGSAAKTRTAMEQALRVEGLTIEEINMGNQATMNYLTDADKKIEINLANAIFWDPMKIKPFDEFLHANTFYYDATLESLNFSDPSSKDVINDWVKEQTNNKIEKIIDEISAEEAMFLMNALYLKGDWQMPFNAELTAQADFHVNPSKTVQVDFMQQESFLPFNQNEDVQVVDLGLGDSLYSVYFVLPREGVDLDSWIGSIERDKLEELMDNTFPSHLSLKLPKFELEYKAKLKSVLSSLGMGEAFSPAEANFSNLGTAGGNIYISRVEHKTKVTVDEKGFEGAAVTAVGVGVTSVPAPLVFNKPFAFFLREKETGTYFFMAKVNDPTEE